MATSVHFHLVAVAQSGWPQNCSPFGTLILSHSQLYNIYIYVYVRKHICMYIDICKERYFHIYIYIYICILCIHRVWTWVSNNTTQFEIWGIILRCIGGDDFYKRRIDRSVPPNWCSWSFLLTEAGGEDGDFRRFLEDFISKWSSSKSLAEDNSFMKVGEEGEVREHWRILFGRFRLMWFGKVLWWGS